ncbi:hypothetical protein [Streptomyces roseoverticillatus]|nr:hypothetical protein [Streptomyces roseoverticillatus]
MDEKKTVDEKKTCESPGLVETGTFEEDTQGRRGDFRDGPSGRRDR